jgi:hypothetical protein
MLRQKTKKGGSKRRMDKFAQCDAAGFVLLST